MATDSVMFSWKTNKQRQRSASAKNRTVSPAVCSLGRQDVGEEHLRQLPQVEELISAAAKGHVEVRAVLLQGCLLKKLRVLHYKRSGESREVGFVDSDGAHKRKDWTWAAPLCLALLIISMCFMETLRSFRVMRDATSTWERERKRKIQRTNVSQHPEALNSATHL